jgi:hypothetical protein
MNGLMLESKALKLSDTSHRSNVERWLAMFGRSDGNGEDLRTPGMMADFSFEDRWLCV